MADQIQMQPEVVRAMAQALETGFSAQEQGTNQCAAALEAARAGDYKGYIAAGLAQGEAALQQSRLAIAQMRELLTSTEVTVQRFEEADQQSPVNELETAPPATPETSVPGAAKTALSVGADFTPVLGELKGFAAIFTGTDLVTGEELGWWRFAGLLGLIGLNEVKHLRHGGKLTEFLGKLFGHGDEAISVARMVLRARSS